MVDTIRTTDGKYLDYFLNGLNTLAEEKGKHVYAGHYHYELSAENFTVVDSEGYNGKHLEINDKGVRICLEADVHLGLPETKANVLSMLERWKNEKYDMIILLGDFLEMQYFTNLHLKQYMEELGMLEFFRTTQSQVYYIVGNHDINIQYTGLEKTLEENNVEVIDSLELKDSIFIHGHQYDAHIQSWGKWKYYLIFKVGDILNLPKSWISYLVNRYK